MDRYSPIAFNSAVHLFHLHQNDAVKARFTHPNPAFFVRKGWPWSVYEHCWVFRVASPLLFAVQITFLTEWMRGYCVFELKPLGWYQVHPVIAHAFTPQNLQLATK